MKERLKKMVAGTWLEPLARRIRSRLPGGAPPAPGDPAARNRVYDIQTRAVMERVLRRSSNTVDAGCHEGVILREALRLAPDGTHFAFEPLPGFHRDLERAFANAPGARIFDYALSDVRGEAAFHHVVSNPGYSGLRRRRYDRAGEDVVEISVRTELLDNVIPEHAPIDFIKVDVEGGELQLLRGAVHTIRTRRPVIVFEHGLGAADRYGATPEAMHDLLADECGLRLFLMSDWLAGDGANALDRDRFCEHFHRGTHYYFLAAP